MLASAQTAAHTEPYHRRTCPPLHSDDGRKHNRFQSYFFRARALTGVKLATLFRALFKLFKPVAPPPPLPSLLHSDVKDSLPVIAMLD